MSCRLEIGCLFRERTCPPFRYKAQVPSLNSGTKTGGVAGLEMELSSSVKQTVSLLRVWLHLNLKGIEPTQTNSLLYNGGRNKECCASNYRMGGYEDEQQFNRGA